MLKILFYILLLFPVGSCFSQSDTLNQIDAEGKKQGYWIVYGVDKPQNIWCDSCKIEEGTYLNNRKNGDWIKYFQDGVTSKLKVAYTRGRPSGYYTKNYPNGNIRESGNFVRGKYKGIYIRYYSSGCIQGETIYNDLGEKEEEYFYYNNCDTAVSLKGKVASGIIQYNSIRGFSIYYYYPNGKLKKVKEVDSLGNVTSRIQKPITEPLPVIKSTNNNSLCPDLTIVEKKKHIKKDGYNKLYNIDYDIYMDGEFKNGCLWDGKYYIYDSNGLLIKIEVWKNGKYHSDAQIEPQTIFSPCDSKYTEDNNQGFIWDGKCVDGKPWEGKMAIYDSDRILLKIEIWKNGKYHSDAKL